MSALTEVEKMMEEEPQEVAETNSLLKPVQSGFESAMTTTIEQASTKGIKELAKDLTYLKSASNLQSDEGFTAEYDAELGKQFISELKDEGKRAAIVAAAKKQEASNLRCAAYYEGCKPIFILLGIEEPFGLAPMIITTILLMLPFLVVSLIRFLINSINSIFTAIAAFTKPAFWLCTIIVTLIITAAIVLLALWGCDTVFGTTIIKDVKPLIAAEVIYSGTAI